MLDSIAITTRRIGWPAPPVASRSPFACRPKRRALQTKPATTCASSWGEVELGIERVALAPFSPYVSNNTRLSLDTGEASISGKLALSSGDSAAKKTADRLRFAGAASPAQLTDQAHAADVCAVDRAVITGCQGQHRRQRFRALSWPTCCSTDQPRGDVVIGEDGTLSLTQIGARPARQSPRMAASATRRPPPAASVPPRQRQPRCPPAMTAPSSEDRARAGHRR